MPAKAFWTQARSAKLLMSPARMATDRPRYTVSGDNELFQQIEDFRFERRFQTRSEATVELIRLGLESLKKEQQTPREKPADEARDD